MKNKLNLSINQAIIASAALLSTFYNVSYYRRVVDVYGFHLDQVGFVGSIVLLQGSLTLLLLSLVGFKYLVKPALVTLFITSSASAYFMDSYGIIIDREMLQNMAQTDLAESLDLFSARLALYLIFLGLLPSYLLIKSDLKIGPFRQEFIARLKLISFALIFTTLIIALFYKPYASFFREHKSVRYYSNPVFYLYSSYRYLEQQLTPDNGPIQPLGLGAHIPEKDIDRELVIMVVGETVRADHFSINGYTKQTNPLLQQESLISFSNFSACGTSTATSVPCMFSILDRAHFSSKKAGDTENLLDVLKHANISILWRDNNSSSKGVADRVAYEDFRSPANNKDCDKECRDAGMLAGLQQHIDTQQNGDIFIVLHQMGNHGPAYYKRYPESFEFFKPSCQTNQLEQCSNEEINNAYDNALRYTDYFLAKTIELLKQNSARFETAMLYVGDHGESLGENGLYLHGLPYLIAPQSQTQVPALLWLGESYQTNRQSIARKKDRALSHDNLFHTLLGLFEIETDEYDESQDILAESW